MMATGALVGTGWPSISILNCGSRYCTSHTVDQSAFLVMQTSWFLEYLNNGNIFQIPGFPLNTRTQAVIRPFVLTKLAARIIFLGNNEIDCVYDRATLSLAIFAMLLYFRMSDSNIVSTYVNFTCLEKLVGVFGLDLRYG